MRSLENTLYYGTSWFFSQWVSIFWIISLIYPWPSMHSSQHSIRFLLWEEFYRNWVTVIWIWNTGGSWVSNSSPELDSPLVLFVGHPTNLYVHPISPLPLHWAHTKHMTEGLQKHQIVFWGCISCSRPIRQLFLRCYNCGRYKSWTWGYTTAH